MANDQPERRLRHAVQLEATVTVADDDCRSTHVCDLSLDGCCISGFYRIGSFVELKIRSLGTFQAQVRWAFAAKAGLRFIRRDEAQSAPDSLIVANRGAAAIEYCVAAAFIAIALILAVAGMGRSVESNFNNVDTAVGGGTQYQSG